MREEGFMLGSKCKAMKFFMVRKAMAEVLKEAVGKRQRGKCWSA